MKKMIKLKMSGKTSVTIKFFKPIDEDQKENEVNRAERQRKVFTHSFRIASSTNFSDLKNAALKFWGK